MQPVKLRFTLDGSPLIVRGERSIGTGRPARSERARGVTDRPEMIFDCASSLKCSAVLLTRGAAGAVLLRPGLAPVPVAAPVVNVVDATGAGDAFVGLFLAFWLSKSDPEAALNQAVQGASLSLTALGAQGRLVSAHEVTAGLNTAETGSA